MLDVLLQQEGPIPLQARLQCAPGELLALVGPSGAGKSTILRVIAGLARVAHAQVRVGSACWQDSAAGQWLAPWQRPVGMVFQSYALFPHLSVLDNVAEPLHALPRPERYARASQVLAQVGLSGLEQRRPHQLSGGQQQRVALARALVRQPEVLLLDEPFAAVDQLTRERLYEELAGLRSQLRIPVVLVTHSLVEAQLLADKLVVLRRGQTLQSGTPQEVMSRPCSEEVARLVGFGNVCESVVQRVQGEQAWVAVGNAELALPLAEGHSVAAGQALRWGIATGDVAVLKDSRLPDEAGQCLLLTLEKAVPLGDNVRLVLRWPEPGMAGLRAVVTQRFAERAQLQVGSAVRVELPRDKLLVF